MQHAASPQDVFRGTPLAELNLPHGLKPRQYERWWKRAHASYNRIMAEGIPILWVPRASWEREWYGYNIDETPSARYPLGRLSSDWWGLVELERRLLGPYIKRAAEREVELRRAGIEEELTREQASRREPFPGPIVVHERRRWRSVLAPIYLQLLEGLRGSPRASAERPVPRVRSAVPDARCASVDVLHRPGALRTVSGERAEALADIVLDDGSDASSSRPRRPTRAVTRRGPDEGSIYQRQDGRWAGSVHIGYEDGKRVRKHVIGHTRSEVKEKLAALQRAQDEKRPIPDQRDKVGPFLRRWLDEVARPTVRASTYASYDDIVAVHLVPGLGRIALAKLTPAEVQAFLNRKLAGGLSPRRVQYIHAVLRRALVTAERWGMVSRNVAKLVDPPRVAEHEITPLTPEQARRSSRPPSRTATGRCRSRRSAPGCARASCWRLRWEDVDLEAGRLRVRHTLANVEGKLTLLEPKTDRSRRTRRAARGGRRRRCGPIAPASGWTAWSAGSRWVDSGHVFTTMLGTPLPRGDHHPGLPGGARPGRAAATAASTTCATAAATFLLAQGMTLEDVKNLLGHSSIVLTSNTYGHVLEQRQRQVARAMDAVLGG